MDGSQRWVLFFLNLTCFAVVLNVLSTNMLHTICLSQNLSKVIQLNEVLPKTLDPRRSLHAVQLFTFWLVTILGFEQTFHSALLLLFLFELHLLLPMRNLSRVKTGLSIFMFQISGCKDGCCSTTTHQPLPSQSCTSWSCGWGPSTWSTGSHTPAEASWCSTIWASHSCPSTCSTR